MTNLDRQILVMRKKMEAEYCAGGWSQALATSRELDGLIALRQRVRFLVLRAKEGADENITKQVV